MALLTGYGWYLWMLSQCGTPQEIADLALVNGCAHLMPKIADGIYDYNKADGDPAKQLTTAAKTVGIDVWGWQYVYLANPKAEAEKAVQRIEETGCTGLVIDAEGEWKEQIDAAEFKQVGTFPSKKSPKVSVWELEGGEDAAGEYLTRLRYLLGAGFPLALSSYRYPSYHPEFPWEVARSFVDMDMPQVYWLLDHNPVFQLNKSYNEFKSFARKLPYLPTGAAWKEQGWAPTVADISGFIGTCKGLNLPGYNFWSWQHAKRDLPEVWATLMPFESDTPPPGTPDYLYPLYTGTRVRDAIYGNITGYTGDTARAYKILGSGVDPNNKTWYRIGDKRWIAGWLCKLVNGG